MPAEETQTPETVNLHRPGAVPGPPAMPALKRPGALPTPAQTGVAPARPGSRETEVQVLTNSVDPPATSAFRPTPSAAPGGPLEIRPSIQPAGTRLIAPPWKERVVLTEEEGSAVAAPVVPVAPRPAMDRANPREAGVRVRQMAEGPWPWSANGLETAAKVDEPWGAADRRRAEEEVSEAFRSRPRRSFPWKAWLAFTIAWVAMFWLVLQREERLDQAQARQNSRGEVMLQVEDGNALPSHIGVENPKEVHLKE